MILPVAHIQSFQDTSLGGPLVNITSNYLLYAPSTRGQKYSKDFLAYTPLPPAPVATGTLGNLQLVKYPLGLQDDERVSAFQLDESQGLLAVVISSISRPAAALKFLSFPRVNLHPLTAAPQAGIRVYFKDMHRCQIQIHEDNVGVLLCGGVNSLTIYDWKTGRIRARYIPTDAQRFTSFSFLTGNTIVTTDLATQLIELWEILTMPKVLRRAATLRLPAIRRGIIVEGLDCTPLSPGQLSNSQISPVITFNLLVCKHMPDGLTSYCSIKIVTYISALLDLGFSPVHPSTRNSSRHSVPWQTWGRIARCFDESCAIDDCNLGGQYFTTLSDADCKKPFKLSVYDFRRAMTLDDVQTGTLEPRFGSEEMKHIPVFDENLYTLRPCSSLRCLSVGPCNRILVDDERVFMFKVCGENVHIRCNADADSPYVLSISTKMMDSQL